jgi:hypothetical protein
MENYSYDMTNALAKIKEPLDPKLIKVRVEDAYVDGKKTTKEFKYVSQATVINILNEAFGHQWSFETPHAFVQEAQPTKVTVYNSATKRREEILDENGDPKLKAEPSYAVVCGRLTIPGLGVKEQWGSCVLKGGSSVQSSAFKAAASDALKKCASLFGVAIELYEDDAPQEESQAAPTPQQQTRPMSQRAPRPTAPAQHTSSDEWTAANKEKYTAERNALSELKKQFGIDTNAQLNPIVRSFTGKPDATWEDIKPSNIGEFVKYLQKQLD